MKTKMRPRYYCDHCGKGSGSASHMHHHEKVCTNNPNRECGMCKLIENENVNIAALIEALDDGGAEGLKRLRELCDNCPACILAAIRQSKLQRPPDFNDDDPCSIADVGFRVPFDFKAEKKAFMEDIKHAPERGVDY